MKKLNEIKKERKENPTKHFEGRYVEVMNAIQNKISDIKIVFQTSSNRHTDNINNPGDIYAIKTGEVTSIIKNKNCGILKDAVQKVIDANNDVNYSVISKPLEKGVKKEELLKDYSVQFLASKWKNPSQGKEIRKSKKTKASYYTFMSDLDIADSEHYNDVLVIASIDLIAQIVEGDIPYNKPEVFSVMFIDFSSWNSYEFNAEHIFAEIPYVNLERMDKKSHESRKILPKIINSTGLFGVKHHLQDIRTLSVNYQKEVDNILPSLRIFKLIKLFNKDIDGKIDIVFSNLIYKNELKFTNDDFYALIILVFMKEKLYESNEEDKVNLYPPDASLLMRSSWGDMLEITKENYQSVPNNIKLSLYGLNIRDSISVVIETIEHGFVIHYLSVRFGLEITEIVREIFYKGNKYKIIKSISHGVIQESPCLPVNFCLSIINFDENHPIWSSIHFKGIDKILANTKSRFDRKLMVEAILSNNSFLNFYDVFGLETTGELITSVDSDYERIPEHIEDFKTKESNIYKAVGIKPTQLKKIKEVSPNEFEVIQQINTLKKVFKQLGLINKNSNSESDISSIDDDTFNTVVDSIAQLYKVQLATCKDTFDESITIKNTAHLIESLLEELMKIASRERVVNMLSKLSEVSKEVDESKKEKGLMLSYFFDSTIAHREIGQYETKPETILRDTARMIASMPELEIALNFRNAAELYDLHDRLVENISALKAKVYQESYEIRYNELESLNYTGDEFSIVVPRKPEDIIHEGNALSHCVGSYLDSICKGKSIVVFVRSNEDLDKPLYTLELSKNLSPVQFKGKYNSTPSQKAISFMKNALKNVSLKKD